jgi:adenosine kinase
MIENKTGWSAEDILERVGIQVTTLGADGVRILARDAETIEVKAAAGVTAVEPTGVGDAFRAGFLAGLEWELGHERAAQVGCVLAAYVVETVGTQEYSFTATQFVERLRGSYDDAAADDVAQRLLS